MCHAGGTYNDHDGPDGFKSNSVCIVSIVVKSFIFDWFRSALEIAPAQRSNHRLLRIRHGRRIEIFEYDPKTTSLPDLRSAIRQRFRIETNRYFDLMTAEGHVLVLSLFDVDLQEVFQLEIGSDTVEGYSNSLLFVKTLFFK